MTVPALSASRLVLSPDAIAKARLRAIDRDRASVRTRTAAMAGDMAAFLAALGAKVAAQITDVLGAQKQRRPGGEAMSMEEAARRAAAALERLDIDDEWEALVSVLEPHLRGMAEDGGRAALTQLAVDDDGVTALMVGRTTKWARARAAEMVGMRRRDDGSLAPNPNAKWRIDESTRDMVRSLVMDALQDGSSTDEIASRLVESIAFSETRAKMVARTEIAKADVAGAMDGYRVSGLVAGKRWSTSDDDVVSEECLECEAAGVIGFDDMFPTGVDAPPNHPNCRCTVLPVLTDEMPAGKTTKGTTMTKLFAAIEKAEKQDDGTIKVYGFASAEVVDSDGEMVTADAMRAARDGYMAFANVREMHDMTKAAGVAIEYEVQDDGRTWFGAHVVDPVAVLKVETGVYKGFSIGAKVPAGGRDGKVIKSIDLREVSLVDRPANPEAVFTMFKADAGEGDETDLKKGMDELRDFANVLRAIGYLASSAEYEAQGEGDKSPLPAELRDWLARGVGIFKAMAEEETAEMMAQLKAMVPAGAMHGDVVAAAAGAGDLQKAGKRFSVATKSALRAAHDALKAADKALADLGYDSDEDEDEGDDAGKADTGADLQKSDADTAEITEIAKTVGLEIAEPTAAALTKAVLSELLTLRKAHADLLASPAAPKGVAKAVAISKVDDRGEDENTEQAPVMKSDGSTDDVATLVKAAQSRPIRLA